MSHSPDFRRRRGEQGFTLIETLVALALIAISLAAIGSLVATSARGARSLDQHLVLVEIARAIVTGLPDRSELKLGGFSGEVAGNRWRVDVLPFVATNVDSRLLTLWVPQAVVIRVQSPQGPILQVNTVRLRRRSDG